MKHLKKYNESKENIDALCQGCLDAFAYLIDDKICEVNIIDYNPETAGAINPVIKISDGQPSNFGKRIGIGKYISVQIRLGNNRLSDLNYWYYYNINYENKKLYIDMIEEINSCVNKLKIEYKVENCYIYNVDYQINLLIR